MQPSELADTAHAASGNPPQRGLNGGRFDFDDGGTYCGGWEDGKAHGHGVCTGPKAQGAYAGSWHFGFEVSGVYTWPSGSSFEGQWQNGKRHGLGVETRDRWLYRGEWTQGYKGRYGIRQSIISNAKYEGTWANGLQDGYGSETYADGDNNIDADILALMSTEDLKELIPKIGDRVKIKSFIQRQSSQKLTFAIVEDPDEYIEVVSEPESKSSEDALSCASETAIRSNVSYVPQHETLHHCALDVRLITIPGTYQGQWMRGLRHGYGVRTSAPFGLASHYRGGGKGHRGSMSSLTEGAADPSERRTTRMDDARGGFVLMVRSDVASGRRGSLVEKTKKGLLSKLRRQRSAGDLDKHGTGSVRSGGSGGSASSWVSSVESSHSAMTHASLHTNSNTSFVVEDEHLDASVTETYMGEWKNDKRQSFGVSERSDGLRYEGEWFANKKYGYGVTTFRDGTKEEGKYKNNVLITSQKRMFLMRSAKFRERVDSAVAAAQRASKIAMQKADIAISRTATARGKAEQADESADQAKEDCDIAQATAKQFAPDFKHPGFDRIGLREKYRQKIYDAQVVAPAPQESEKILDGKSIPNHIPPKHSQLPQTSQVPSAPSRRPSAQFPKPMQSMQDSRIPNNTKFNADNRIGSPYDPYSNAQPQDSWASTNAQPGVQDYQKPYSQNEQMGAYGSSVPGGAQLPAAPYRLNRQDSLQHQQSMDQSGQQFTNQGRRLSAAMRPTLNQNRQQPAPQEWNQSQGPVRRQSVLGQPTFNAPENTYVDPRNDYRTGTVHSESTLERQAMAADPQGYRQAMEQGYRQPIDQGYRQAPEQMYRQATADSQGFRQPSQMEQDMANGAREMRPPGARPSIDYFDHYKRPPSRDSSVDRYGRRSRQPSVEAAVPSSGSRAGSVAPQPAPTTSSRPPSRAATPAGNGHLATGRGSISRAGSREPQPFEESLLRQRNLGQDISPSPYQPKRTESLYVAPNPAPPPPVKRAGGGGGGGGGGGRKMLQTPQTTLQRKKSLPDVAGMPRMSDGAGMCREEVSMLGSARREEVRRIHEETEKLRANPLLYLVSPQVKDWFSRQQLVILVLFINISLGIMFFKLLT